MDFSAARSSGGLVVAEISARQSRRQAMKTKEFNPGNESAPRARDRDLERILRDALALAVSKKAADQALRQARNKAHTGGRHGFPRIAGHLAGYGTLLTFIWHQRKAQKQSAR